MGEKERQQNQELYAEMAKHVYDKAHVLYQGQAERLGLTQSKFQGMRTDPRYIVTDGDIAQFRDVFREELEGYGTPSELDQELAKLREDLARLESLLADKAGDVEELLREKGKLQEENKRLIEKYAAFLEKLVDPDKVREIIEGATRLNDGEK